METESILSESRGEVSQELSTGLDGYPDGDQSMAMGGQEDDRALPSDRRYSDSHSRRQRSISRSRSRSESRRRRRSSSPHRDGDRRDIDDRRGRRPRSGSRSRSPSRSRRYRRSPSHSRSRSRSPIRRRYDSRSPPRRQYRSRGADEGRSRRQKELHGTRDRPETSNILGVFGLSLRTREEDLEKVFGEYGKLDKVVIVYDHRSGRSRGFGFVYFEKVEDACRAREATNGLDIDDREIRVDFSVTHRPHTPTPGEYMGERSRGGDRDRRSYMRRRRSRSRTPSPRRRRRTYRSRSRSRSWSR